MRTTTIAVATLALSLGTGAALAKDKPKETVRFAPSWEEAVEEAKLLNVPIVVHNHGFNCGPCWSMHGSVLQNKDYIKFAEQNCVDVLALQDLESGIAAKDRRAGTYKAKNEKGEEVEYLLSWPGLTVEQVKKLFESKARTYNDTRGIPFTGIIDPHTEERMSAISGARPAGAVIDAVTEAKKKLAEKYGEGISRKAYRELREKQASIRGDLEKGDVVKATATQRALEGKFTRAAEPVQKFLAATRSEILGAAAKQLDEAEAMLSGGRAKEAAALLAKLAPALRGTDLEARHAELVAKAKPTGE